MKHYTKEKGYGEIDLFDERADMRGSHRTERNATAAKKGYRRRERRALKRSTADEIAAELNGYTEAERRYWWGEFMSCRCDFDDLYCAEEYLRESGEWTEDHTRIFAAAYREVRRRSEAAYNEWFIAA